METTTTPTPAPEPPVKQLFASGDVVKLASGGPDMTVDNYACAGGALGYCWCRWFETVPRPGMPQELKQRRFLQDSLALVKAKTPVA